MRRQSKSLGPSLEHGLSMYALAASAAGVGMLALVQPAEAKIVYIPAQVAIGPNDEFQLDLNADGTRDFLIWNSYLCNSDICTCKLYVYPTRANGAEGARQSGFVPLVYALPKGSRIGPDRPFSAQFMTGGLYGGYGQWFSVRNRYIGLKFKIKGKTHYGWARLSVQYFHSGFRIVALLTGYAYETIPNKPIIAGKTHGGASLGALAAGSTALTGRRHKIRSKLN